MRSAAGFTVVAMFALAVSLVSFSQPAQAGTVEEVAAMGWGGNVEVTCALTQGQTLGELFSPALSVADMAKKWKENWEKKSGALGSVPQDTKDKIAKALEDLNSAISSGGLKSNAKDLNIKKWKELPGEAVNKAKARTAFDELQKNGMLMLKFINRPEDQDADQETTETMDAVVVNMGTMTQADIYTTPADPIAFPCEFLNLLSYAMDGIHLLRTASPNGLKATNSCCNRTTRKCTVGTGSCTTCGTTCCLGSTWCP